MSRPVLLSDIGNVLVRFDLGIAARRLEALSECSAEEMFLRIGPVKDPYESGQIDDDAFVRECIRRIGFHGQPEEFAAAWCEIFSPNPAMERTLAAFPPEVPKFLLSNTNALHKDHLLRTFSIFQHFTGGVYSYSARCSKPDEAIFRHAIEHFDLDPAQTLFIDDLEPNIASARRLGFATHLYRMDCHDRMEVALAAWLRGHGLAG